MPQWLNSAVAKSFGLPGTSGTVATAISVPRSRSRASRRALIERSAWGGGQVGLVGDPATAGAWVRDVFDLDRPALLGKRGRRAAQGQETRHDESHRRGQHVRYSISTWQSNTTPETRVRPAFRMRN